MVIALLLIDLQEKLLFCVALFKRPAHDYFFKRVCGGVKLEKVV